MDVLFDREMPSVGFHRGSEFMSEFAKTPKCFAIYIDEPSYRIRFWFSKKHYIRQQIASASYWEDIYTLHKHNLTLAELYIIKNFQFGKGMGPLQSLEEYGENRENIENDELCEVFERQFLEAEKNKLAKERQDFEVEKNELMKEKKAFEIEKHVHESEIAKYKKFVSNKLAKEREEFEQEKHAHEIELAKYKRIVYNCQKEINAYFG